MALWAMSNKKVFSILNKLDIHGKMIEKDYLVLTSRMILVPIPNVSFSVLHQLCRIVALLTVGFLVSSPVSGQSTRENNGVKRTPDVIYGRKAGMVLTVDVFEPAQKNGSDVVFLVSGGWAPIGIDCESV